MDSSKIDGAGSFKETKSRANNYSEYQKNSKLVVNKTLDSPRVYCLLCQILLKT